MKLFDSHAHLNDPAFRKDREKVLRRAEAAGVTHILVPGYTLETSQIAVNLAQEHPGTLFAAVGIHPHDAETATPEALEEIRRMAHQDGVVAIGEIGLDFYRNLSPRDVQIKAFEAQVELANETGLPIVIHVRESFREVVEVLRRTPPKAGAVFHSFSLGKNEARVALDLGGYISFSGMVTYQNGKLQKTARFVPQDRILIETDSPYLTPAPVRRKTRRNEPAFVRYTLEYLAELRKVSPEELARQTFENAWKILPIPRGGMR